MPVMYHHTQRGLLMPSVMAAVCLIFLIVSVRSLTAGPASAMIIAVMAVLFCLFALLGWYFSSMTIEVTDDELLWHFGPGGGFRIARAEIEGAQLVHHPWWGGYGIRFRSPNRRIYIIAGHDAVEVRLRDGGWRRLGTDDPRGLLAGLNAGEQHV